MSVNNSFRSPGRLHLGRPASAFTLIEILLVIAVIGIMSALILTSVGNATRDSRLVVARQQQVVLQEALHAWIAAQSSTSSITTVRSNYTGTSDKLALLQDYLGDGTYNHMVEYTTNSQIGSDALQKSGKYLQFSAWTTTNYPTVSMAP